MADLKALKDCRIVFLDEDKVKREYQLVKDEVFTENNKSRIIRLLNTNLIQKL